ncbi:hypothetical protein DPMN_110431, partial [Dreissena polymorpha]
EFLIGDKKIKKISRDLARKSIEDETHYSRYSRTFRQAHIQQLTSRLKVEESQNYLSPITSFTPSPASSRSCRDDVPKVANYVEVAVPQYLPDDFKTFFRMTRGTFERVLERISTHDQLRRRIATGGREQVPFDKDLLMTL